MVCTIYLQFFELVMCYPNSTLGKTYVKNELTVLQKACIEF